MLKENRVFVCLSGDSPEQFATEFCEVSFFLFFSMQSQTTAARDT